MKRCAVFLVLVLLLAACAAKPPAPEPAPPPPPPPAPAPDVTTKSAPFPKDIFDNSLVTVYYATDRKADRSGLIPYGTKRGDLSYGQCVVSVPRDHRLGDIERSKDPDPRRDMYVMSLYAMDWNGLRESLAWALRGSPEKKALVFVHGYNNSFEDAALRTAQLAYDLQFDGPPIFYSWPSAEALLKYKEDRKMATDPATFGHLRAFLQEVAEQTGAERIYLIAHSMGNEVLTRAFADLLAGLAPETREKFREIVLASPDIGAEDFVKNIAPRILNQGPGVTLYASRHDEALKASWLVNDFKRRLGDPTKGAVVLPGMDTIDASAVRTDFLGHAYFAEHASIVSDLFYGLNYEIPVQDRFALQPATQDGKPYWKLRKVLYGDTD